MNYGACPNSAANDSCILLPEDAETFCDAAIDCGGISETSDTTWLESFAGKVQLGRGPLQANSDWKSCIKPVTSPQAGLCPAGYILQDGALGNYGDCPGTAETGFCILPPEDAVDFCNNSVDCSGISETSDPDWRSSHPGRILVGKGSVVANEDWKSCIKPTPAAQLPVWQYREFSARFLLRTKYY